MSERDYSRLDKSLQPESWPNTPYCEALSNKLLDLMDANDALAKRIEDIEDAEDVRHSKAEAAQTEGRVSHEEILKELALPDGVGEASAESEWPRYYRHKQDRGGYIRYESADKPGRIVRFDGGDAAPWTWTYQQAIEFCLDSTWHEVPADVAGAHIAAARGEKPSLDDAFPIPAQSASSHTLYKTGDKDAPEQIKDSNGEVVLGQCRVCGKAESELDEPCESKPIPAPVEQGPTEGMKAAAESLRFAQGWSVESIAAHLNHWIRPELSAKDAEMVRLKADNVRLKDDYQVAVNNIGYRSQELREARLEIERLKAERTEVEEAWGQLRRDNFDLTAKLVEAILLWQEAAAKAESFRKAACIESEKRVAEWHEKERGNDPTGT